MSFGKPNSQMSEEQAAVKLEDQFYALRMRDN